MIPRYLLIKCTISGIDGCPLHEVHNKFCYLMDLIICKIMYKLELHNFTHFDTKEVVRGYDYSIMQWKNVGDYK